MRWGGHMHASMPKRVQPCVRFPIVFPVTIDGRMSLANATLEVHRNEKLIGVPEYAPIRRLFCLHPFSRCFCMHECMVAE